MSNSALVSYTRLSPNCNRPRSKPIMKITPHHQAGNLSLETLGNIMANPSRQMSCTYGIDSNGRIGLYVDETNRPWTSSSPINDHQAITIEVANDGGAPDWHVSDKALAALIELCVDICKRNGIPKLNFTGDATGNLTQHNYFAPTACPGAYLGGKFPYIESEVNKRLGSSGGSQGGSEGTDEPDTLYRVQIGAFSKKENAAAMQSKVKSAGFATYMVKVEGLYKVQVGAFGVKANAEAQKQKLDAAGFDSFITTKSGSPVSGENIMKPIEEVAIEVLAGKWGHGADRKNRLTQAGYDFDKVQARVNELA